MKISENRFSDVVKRYTGGTLVELGLTYSGGNDATKGRCQNNEADVTFFLKMKTTKHIHFHLLQKPVKLKRFDKNMIIISIL